MSIKKPVTRDTVEDKFIKVPRYFIERGRYLTPQAKWVWVVLKYFENYRTKQIFPSHSTIEELSGLSKTAVSKALKELEEFLWIIKQTEPGKVTRYQLSYHGRWKNEELEEAVAPLPSKKYAENHKTEQRKRRAKKNGTFVENAISLVQDKNIAKKASKKSAAKRK